MHVLHNEVGCTEVEEAAALVSVVEKVAQQYNHLLLAVILVDQVLLALYNLEALAKLLRTVLAAHVGREVLEVAAGDVDHVLLAHLRFRTTRHRRGHARALAVCRHGGLFMHVRGLRARLVLVLLAVLLLNHGGGGAAWFRELVLVVDVVDGGQLVEVLLVLVVEDLRVLYLVQEVLRWLVVQGLLLYFELLHLGLRLGQSLLAFLLCARLLKLLIL